MHKTILLFVEFFISKRIHIGLLAFVCSALLGSIFTNKPHYLTPLLSGLIVWAAYLENLTTDTKEDSLGEVPHGILPKIESKLFPIEKFYVYIYISAALLSFFISLQCLLWTLLTIIVFASYVQSWIPSKQRGKIRLKEIYIVKNLIPPLGWGLSVFIVPFATSNTPFFLEIWLFFIVVLLCSFKEEIKFDIPDIKGDILAGIKTFPNTLGEEKTKIILHCLNVSAILLLIWTAVLLKGNERLVMYESILRHSVLLGAYFLFDYKSAEFLFKTQSKEYCNIGIVWFTALLALYASLAFPYNILILLLLRISMSLLPNKQLLADTYLSWFKSKETS